MSRLLHLAERSVAQFSDNLPNLGRLDAALHVVRQMPTSPSRRLLTCPGAAFEDLLEFVEEWHSLSVRGGFLSESMQ